MRVAARVILAIGLLGAAGVVADRVAVGIAEHRAVDAITRDVQNASSPTVTIHGFPFLTQLAAGSLHDVTAHLPTITIAGTEFADVDVAAVDVGTTQPATVHHLTVTGTLPAATLERLIAERTGMTFTITTADSRVIGSAHVLGLPVTAVVVPHLDAGVLRVELTDLTLAGAQIGSDALPGGLAAGAHGVVVPIDALPDGVTLTDVTVGTDGVRVTATGTDITAGAGALAGATR